MLKSYLRTTLRQWRTGKIYTTINMLGLAAGMAVTLLIACWVNDELTFDHYHDNHTRIAQVMSTQPFDGTLTTDEGVPIPLANELRTYPSRFKKVALVYTNYTHVLYKDENKISASGVWAQPDFPEMMTLKMVRGRRDALKDPSSALIDQTVATALFGSTDPLGQSFHLADGIVVKVGGVFEDLPENTSFYGTRLILAWDKAPRVMPLMTDLRTKWDAS